MIGMGLRSLVCAAAFGFIVAQPLAAQPAPLMVSSGGTVEVGYYSFVKNDCSGGATPQIKVATPPSHGQLIAKRATLTTKRLTQCGETKAPTIVVVYKADSSYVGSVPLSFDIVNGENGAVQRINVMVNVAADKI